MPRQPKRKSRPESKSKSTKRSAPVKKMASRTEKADANDIINIIRADHKPLKQLIKILKNNNANVIERQDAFDEFVPLLLLHARCEEQSLYAYLKEGDELREEGFEGMVEHGIAEQLLYDIKRTEESDQWSARVKVLAELVEHHLQEEEDKMLPNFKKHSEPYERIQIGEEYRSLRTRLGAPFVERDVTSIEEREIRY